MNMNSGKFTAPRTGTYFFIFTGIVPSHVDHPKHGGRRTDFLLEMHLNGKQIEKWETGTIKIQSTLNLQAADQIWLQIVEPRRQTNSVSGGQGYNFNGWLLDENISQSLSVN